MFDVKIDRDEPVELYEQVAAEIRRAIADGEALRASDCRRRATWPFSGVNGNTVLRAPRIQGP